MKDQNKSQRSLCPICRKKPVAINRYLGKKVYYRKICDCCSRAKAAGKPMTPQPPGWIRSGYKKKPQCEVCGFRLKFDSQSKVYHLDGNTQNNYWSNLKTVCANCQIELENKTVTWRPADLVPDF